MVQRENVQTPDGNLLLIGWREWVALPDLCPVPIKAKIDTGAKTSTLHAFFIEPYAEAGVQMVQFLLHPYQRNTKNVVECHTPVVDRRLVRDSGGHQELRYVISSTFVIGGQKFAEQLTLTDRDSMLFRMLLGRNAIANKFTVQCGESFLLGGTRKSPPRS